MNARRALAALALAAAVLLGGCDLGFPPPPPSTLAPATTAPAPSTTSRPRPRRHVGLVVRVVDGDTFDLRTAAGARPTRVRMVGVDTPETHKPGTPVQCFGPEAAAYATSRLLGGRVVVVEDSSGERLDAHGRLLGYVFSGREHVNLTLVRLGYATAYPYGKRTRDHRAAFARAQAAAIAERNGGWEACAGDPRWDPTRYTPAPAGPPPTS